MDKVASMLERKISSVQAQYSEQERGNGPSQRLLTSPSADSMGELRSPNDTGLDDIQVQWQPRELSEDQEAMTQSPFAAAAMQPLEETVIVTPSCIYHGLVRNGNRRIANAMNTQDDSEAVDRWKNQRLLHMFWFAVAAVTLISSIRWFQLGVWGGILGIIGASVSMSSCSSDISVNVQVTRLLAVATSALSISGAVLFAFFLAKLQCPKKLREADSCALFRLAMAAVGAWHAFHAGVAILVAVRAAQLKLLFDPGLGSRVIVLQTARSTPV